MVQRGMISRLDIIKDKIKHPQYMIPPEMAHGLAVAALRMLPVGVMPESNPVLRQRLWNIDFQNPVGLAAGFDKNAEVAHKMYRFGFGFAEAGTVTPKPQAGNPKPRIFRLREDRAVINRLGFNNKGLDYYVRQLQRARASLPSGAVLGANIGMNRDSAHPLDDIQLCLKSVYALADYVVINISSPNTPGLRGWQEGDALTKLIDAAHAARQEQDMAGKKPVLFKIAPDLTPEQVSYIAHTALDKKLDGVVISNTTISRPPELEGAAREQQGGLSGRPLFRPSTSMLRRFYRLTEGKIPLIGVGGVSSGLDAYRKIKAGASLVQLYTSMVYQGPQIAVKIARDLAELLQKDGIAELRAAIGVECGEKFDHNMF